MRILVTGGAGFIGSNLINTLKIKYPNCEIISLDNYSSGTVDNHIHDVLYIEGNTFDIKKIPLLKNFCPDIIFHFGEYSRVCQSLDEPDKTFLSNTYGTQQILDYAVQNNSKLIYSGSSAIFGNNMKDQNLNPYAWTKSKNIELIHNYHDWYGLNYAICYFYNVYGRNQIKTGKYATVIGTFEQQYETNQLLTVVKPGTQTRIFTHIDDIIDGIILVAEKGFGDDYFLYFDEKHSIIDVAKMFSETKYIFVDERKGEREQSIIFESRAIKELNWKPKNRLQDYIDNFKQNCCLKSNFM